jgi:putative ABC transport system permease protein
MHQDFKYALRALTRNPGFAPVAVLILALGIAANTTIYTVVDSVLLRPLSFQDPDRLVMAWERHPIIGKQEVALPDFHDWQARNHSFSGMAAYTMQGDLKPLWSVNGEPEPLQATLASSNLFSLLGVSPVAGRLFSAEEDRPGHNQTVLLSHRLWVARFAADPRAIGIGRTMVLGGETFQIVGVLPEAGVIPRWADVWLPLSRSGPDTQLLRAYHNLEVAGRLKPGISVAQADSDIQAIAAQLSRENPVTNGPTGAHVIPIRQNYVEHLEKALLLLQAGAVLVLLICCANIAIFSLIRVAKRRNEMGIRAALGASPAQLIRGSLAEALVIALFGGALGTVLARLATGLLETRIAALLPFAWRLAFDWRVLLFSFVSCLATAFIFGLLPSLRVVRHGAFRGASRAAVGGGGTMSQILIALQTAMAVVVLVCTGLLAKSFRQILLVQPGFETTHLLAVRLSLPQSKYNSALSLGSLYERLFSQIRELPGVTGVAATSQAPLTRSGGRFWIEGEPDPPPNQFPVAQFRDVSPGYFDVVGLRLLGGRMPHGLGEPEPVVWVNQAFERRFFGSKSAAGHAILQGLIRPPRRRIPIAGVVSNMRDLGLETEPEPTVYWIDTSRRPALLVRAAGDPEAAALGIRAALRAADPDIWAAPVEPMDRVYTGALRDRQLAMEMLGLFAVISCLLAGLGVQAVVAHAVVERTRETGLRLAIGAGHGDVIRMFMRSNLRAVIAGLLVGASVAVVAAGLLRRMLFGVGTVDPVTYCLAAILILAIAAVAAYVPARRAIRIDPWTALRVE